MLDSDDFISKACENFSFHLKSPSTLIPTQHQVVEALCQHRDVLAILLTGYGKSMIFHIYVVALSLSDVTDDDLRSAMFQLLFTPVEKILARCLFTSG